MTSGPCAHEPLDPFDITTKKRVFFLIVSSFGDRGQSPKNEEKYHKKHMNFPLKKYLIHGTGLFANKKQSAPKREEEKPEKRWWFLLLEMFLLVFAVDEVQEYHLIPSTKVSAFVFQRHKITSQMRKISSLLNTPCKNSYYSKNFILCSYFPQKPSAGTSKMRLP